MGTVYYGITSLEYGTYPHSYPTILASVLIEIQPYVEFRSHSDSELRSFRHLHRLAVESADS